jgi:hypothetical protein
MFVFISFLLNRNFICDFAPAATGTVFVRNVLRHSVLIRQKIFHSDENGKNYSRWEAVREGFSLDEWPEGETCRSARKIKSDPDLE